MTTDAGESRAHMLNWFRSASPARSSFLTGGGGMGYAIGAALGAKLAHPDGPVLATCADGGFAMTMNTLMNAVHERLPSTVVIFNNRALGWPLHVMPESKKQPFDFHDFDHAAVARAMGCNSVRVESPAQLRHALERARDADLPTVIDVPITVEASYLDSTASIA